MRKLISTFIISSMILTSNFVFADTIGAVTQNKDGTYSKTNTYNLKSVQDADAMTILTAFSIGALGTKLLMYEKKTYDMYVAMAGSAIYLVGAVMNLIQTKNELKAINVDVTFQSDGKVDSSQVESIRKLKESWEKGRDSLERLKSLQNIAMYGFLAASAVALVQRVREEGLKDGCLSGITSASTQLKGLCASASADSVGCYACVARLDAMNADLLGTEVKKAELTTGTTPSTEVEGLMSVSRAKTVLATKAPCSSAVGQSAKATVDWACTAYLGEEKLNSAFGKIDAIGYQNNDKFLFVEKAPTKIAQISIQKSLRNILNKFIPLAHANYIESLGLVGGAATAFITQKFAYGNYIDRFLWSPTGRIFAWGALAGLVKMASDTTQKRIDDANENISKLDNILNETDRLKRGIQVSASVKRQSVQLVESVAPQFDTVTLPNGAKTNCLDSANTSKCSESLKTGMQQVSISSLPDGIQSFSSQLISSANTLSGQNRLSGSSLNSLGSIGAKGNAIGKFVTAQKIAINDSLKNQGRGVIDFTSRENDFKKGLFNASADGFKKSGMSATQLLASIDPSFRSSGVETDNKKTDSSLVKGKSKTITPTASVNTSQKKDEPVFKLEEDKSNGETLADGTRAGSASDKYDMKGTDINKDSGVSIFKIISQRYYTSGYPKLLEEVK